MQHIWESFLKIIKEEAGMQVVETWFKAVSLHHWDLANQTAYLTTPNQFVQNWIKEHYSLLIKTHLSRLLHVTDLNIIITDSFGEKSNDGSIIPASSLSKPTSLEVVSSTISFDDREHNQRERAKNALVAKSCALRKKQRATHAQLNPQYTFDTFVVGPNSSLAHAAAYAISQNLGKVYNPLFIYGDTGLGKTHLLHAIGNETQRKFPAATVLYETSEHFISEYINSIKLDRAQQFKSKYHKIDLLLLDDVQFFSSKEQTQEMLFHIFNLLFERQKQIAFSSDMLPQDIIGLHNRLKSRLQSGLLADIQVPSLETKMAILKKKAVSAGIELDDTTLTSLATLPVTSVRELEGFLIRISAFASLMNAPITADLAAQVINKVHEKRSNGVEIDTILKAIAKYFKISLLELKSDKRNKRIAFARQVAFYMMKKLTVSSLQTIGVCLGGRDHTTVRHAVNKIESLQKNDRELQHILKSIEKMVVSE